MASLVRGLTWLSSRHCSCDRAMVPAEPPSNPPLLKTTEVRFGAEPKNSRPRAPLWREPSPPSVHVAPLFAELCQASARPWHAEALSHRPAAEGGTWHERGAAQVKLPHTRHSSLPREGVCVCVVFFPPSALPDARACARTQVRSRNKGAPAAVPPFSHRKKTKPPPASERIFSSSPSHNSVLSSSPPLGSV